MEACPEQIPAWEDRNCVAEKAALGDAAMFSTTNLQAGLGM